MFSFTKEWFISALKRALHTMAQTALAFIVVGKGFADLDWLSIASVAGVAGIVSFLKSIVIGTPESSTDGTLEIDESDPEKSLYLLNVETPLDKVATMKSIRLLVNTDAVIEKKAE